MKTSQQGRDVVQPPCCNQQGRAGTGTALSAKQHPKEPIWHFCYCKLLKTGAKDFFFFIFLQQCDLAWFFPAVVARKRLLFHGSPPLYCRNKAEVFWFRSQQIMRLCFLNSLSSIYPLSLPIYWRRPLWSQLNHLPWCSPYPEILATHTKWRSGKLRGNNKKIWKKRRPKRSICHLSSPFSGKPSHSDCIRASPSVLSCDVDLAKNGQQSKNISNKLKIFKLQK